MEATGRVFYSVLSNNPMLQNVAGKKVVIKTAPYGDDLNTCYILQQGIGAPVPAFP